jgi:hypothetical protein
MAAVPSQNRYAGGPSPSGLADVLDLILDKGLVVDLYLRVSLVGIELLTIDARIVVASVDTYLRFAEAVERLSIGNEPMGVPQMVKEGPAMMTKSATTGAIDAAAEKLGEWLGGDDD